MKSRKSPTVLDTVGIHADNVANSTDIASI